MNADPPDSSEAAVRRVIKRYSNRKLYDTKDSRYVTLAQIAEFVRAGEDVQVIDNATKEDKTEATLALIISEEAKTRPKAVPLSTLRALVHTQGEKILTQLREGPIGRLFPGTEDENATPIPGEEGKPFAVPAETRSQLQKLVESSRQTLEEWQAAIDERVHTILPGVFRDQENEVRQLTRRVEALEAQLASRDTGANLHANLAKDAPETL